VVWLRTTARDLLDDIYRCSFKRQTGVSLKYIIDFGQYPIERQMLVSAQFLHKVRARLVHATRLRPCSSPPTLSRRSSRPISKAHLAPAGLLGRCAACLPCAVISSALHASTSGIVHPSNRSWCS
jgi:hypothetical protein